MCIRCYLCIVKKTNLQLWTKKTHGNPYKWIVKCLTKYKLIEALLCCYPTVISHLPWVYFYLSVAQSETLLKFKSAFGKKLSNDLEPKEICFHSCQFFSYIEARGMTKENFHPFLCQYMYMYYQLIYFFLLNRYWYLILRISTKIKWQKWEFGKYMYYSWDLVWNENTQKYVI